MQSASLQRDTGASPRTPMLQRDNRGFALHKQPAIVEGQVYAYHKYEITIQEHAPSATARFPRHVVRIRHLPCNRVEWRTVFTPNRETLNNEIRPICEAHECPLLH